MKEALTNHGIDGQEEMVREIEANHCLIPGALTSYYHHLLMVRKNSADLANQTNDEAKKINRKWTKYEMDFMFQYIHARQDEGALNITEILEEIAQLLNRGYQSVNYKYYSLVKNGAKKQVVQQPQMAIKFATIAEETVPVMATTLIGREQSNSQVHFTTPTQTQADGLLDILSGFITNVQQLPGLNLNQLLKSLYELTNLALQNQNAVQQITNIKTEMDQEKQILQDKLAKAEKQLRQEKQRHLELVENMSNLANEINSFNNLSDAAKIQNLKAFNQRLNQIIHKENQIQPISRLV